MVDQSCFCVWNYRVIRGNYFCLFVWQKWWRHSWTPFCKKRRLCQESLNSKSISVLRNEGLGTSNCAWESKNLAQLGCFLNFYLFFFSSFVSTEPQMTGLFQDLLFFVRLWVYEGWLLAKRRLQKLLSMCLTFWMAMLPVKSPIQTLGLTS